MRYLLLVLLLAAGPVLRAQTGENEYMVPKSFLVLLSTKNYDVALKAARSAASGLGYKLQLRGLKPNKREGLTFSPAGCDSNGWDWPCYVARGRSDDGTYLSIERSDAYEGFSKGYYIVIAASGEVGDEDLKTALAKTRQWYEDAYLKTARVYMGCMH